MVDAEDILDALDVGESKDWEFKSGRGGLPQSLWETYSAMANTDGGVIVVGVKTVGAGQLVEGISDHQRLLCNFWNTINDRGKVSINLLDNRDVQTCALQGKQVMAITVPRASRRQRPVYVGRNPLEGTFRRNFEGDYRCSREEVGRMLADQSDEPADSRVLEGFGVEDLDAKSIQQFRQLFATVKPGHPWLVLETKELLEKLGGWRRDRRSGIQGLTVAGLLVFGTAEAIRDPSAIPNYGLDYRERLAEDPAVRWTDRLTLDGMWAGNLLQFLLQVIPRVTRDLSTPFRLAPDLFRRDTSPVHEALREAVVNALVHADYRGMGGIIIERHRTHIELSNPGSLLVSQEQLRRGGVSECRNKSVQLMFQMIGAGDKAGSGMDKIMRGWESQSWRDPDIYETTQPDRVILRLSMAGRWPEETIAGIRERFGSRMDALTPLEVETLATAELEGSVSNARLQMSSDTHAADLTRMLRGLVARGFLEQRGQKRGTTYVLAGDDAHVAGVAAAPGDADRRLAHSDPDLQHSGQDLLHNGRDLLHNDPDLLQDALADLPEDDVRQLVELAHQTTQPGRRHPEETRRAILRFARGRHLTVRQIAVLLGRSVGAVRVRFIVPMVREGLLAPLHPDQPNRPDQAYTAATDSQREALPGVAG